MIKIVIAFIAAALILVSGVIVLQDRSVSNPSGVLVDTIVGNASNPQASHQFQGVNVSTNLWNLQSGDGNTAISVYSNSSMHVFSNYTNIITKTANIVGYPSARFRYGLPITTSDAIRDNISSTVSFNLVNTSQNLPVDITYDIMVQPSATIFSPVVEIMIYIYYAPYLVNYAYLGQFNTISIVNGTVTHVTWIAEKSKSATNGAPLVRFFPNIQTYNSMSYSLNLSSFILEAQSLLSLDLNNDYIQQINIGMEFGFSSFSHYEFSLWLSATCEMNGTRVNILGELANTTQPINPPILEARP